MKKVLIKLAIVLFYAVAVLFALLLILPGTVAVALAMAVSGAAQAIGYLKETK